MQGMSALSGTSLIMTRNPAKGYATRVDPNEIMRLLRAFQDDV